MLLIITLILSPMGYLMEFIAFFSDEVTVFTLEMTGPSGSDKGINRRSDNIISLVLCFALQIPSAPRLPR